MPTAANATFYADIIHQRAILRNVIAAGTKIAQLGYTAEGSQAEDVVNLAQAEVYEMSTGKVRQDYAPIGTVITDTLDQIDRLQNGEVSKGVPTGFRDIDDVTQGLQPGQMIVVAGRPAMGKSTLGVDFARAAALHHNMTSVIDLQLGNEQNRTCATNHFGGSEYSAVSHAPSGRNHAGTLEYPQ